MNQPNLYQLQASWDDERAHQQITDLRRQFAPTAVADLRWGALALLTLPALAIAAAALSRGFWS